MTQPAYLGLQYASFDVANPSAPLTALRLNPRLTDRGKQLLRDKFGDRVKLG